MKEILEAVRVFMLRLGGPRKPVFKNTVDLVEKLKAGFVWRSEIYTVGYVRAFGFTLLGRDWNPYHANPFTAPFFKSCLGGMAVHGDFVWTLPKEAIHRMFTFQERTEVVATACNNTYPKALHPRDTFRYTYTLKEIRLADDGSAWTMWKIVVTNLTSGRTCCRGTWETRFSPIEVNWELVYKAVLRTGAVVYCCMVLAFTALSLSFGWIPGDTPNEQLVWLLTNMGAST